MVLGFSWISDILFSGKNKFGRSAIIRPVV